ncbi:MAG: sulfatase [Acidobacteria bacterium]|uniref:Sulfatase n=1 Tax=Candidatus Polarisedimenticola svalbardensis TaxID=2886004 RepID=A0A8J7CLU0_9BACT|nr:sulfatase [Candidatus Polarisedimenticola svalbardensis]
MSPAIRALSRLAVIITALMLMACSSDAPKPNIVLIVMDTTRQDHLSCYGYDRANTPNLEELARESTLFRSAYSVGSWTPPGHASLFTGLYPAAHGCTQENWTLSGDLVTLAEILGGAGYRTVGITENATVSAASGFDQGFDEYHETWRHDIPQDNPAVALFNSSMATIDPEFPFFLFVNFIEPHAPYKSSGEFIDTYVKDPGSGPDGNDTQDYYLGRLNWNEPEFAHMQALYDAEILYTDQQIGRIIDRLKQDNLWDNTVFIVTSDHGENIGDHGHMEHYFTLYESVVRIPLLIHYPQAFPPGAEDNDPTQLTDLVPTLLNLLELGEGDTQGIDLLETGARKDRPVLLEFYWPAEAIETYGEDWDSVELNRWKRHLRAVIYGDDKLIWASDGDHELYDLQADPAEENNLTHLPGGADKVEALTSLLENLIKRYHRDIPGDRISGGPELDEETREALRSLGYVR